MNAVSSRARGKPVLPVGLSPTGTVASTLYTPASAGTRSYVTSPVFPPLRLVGNRVSPAPLNRLFLMRKPWDSVHTRFRAHTHTHIHTHRRLFELFSARLQVPLLKPVLHLSLQTQRAIKEILHREAGSSPLFPGLFVRARGSTSDSRDDCITVISSLASYSWLTDGAPAGSPSAPFFVINSI